MSPELAAIDAALRLVDREVWIVTAQHASHSEPKRGGLCATWVSAASIDPARPTVVAGLAPNHFTAELVLASGFFGLHLLTHDQAPLALSFALGSGRERDKLANLKLKETSHGTPLLADCLARFECRVFSLHNTGDRIYFWADVLSGETSGSGPPLREQTLLASASDIQRQQLAANRREDAAYLTPFHESWRNREPFLRRNPS